VASYRVDITRSVEKELEALAVQNQRRVITRMRALASDPRPHGSEKLSGEEKYRIRQGDLRIIYSIDDPTLVVTVVKIGHRRDVYR
jgi:mRNA interferase RelE/StbE